MSGWVASIPVSRMPTLVPRPRLTAYEPVGLALMIRMSHWQTESTSGPTPTPPGGWYCWAHPAGAVGGFVAVTPRAGSQRSFG